MGSYCSVEVLCAVLKFSFRQCVCVRLCADVIVSEVTVMSSSVLKLHVLSFTLLLGIFMMFYNILSCAFINEMQNSANVSQIRSMYPCIIVYFICFQNIIQINRLFMPNLNLLMNIKIKKYLLINLNCIIIYYIHINCIITNII